ACTIVCQCASTRSGIGSAKLVAVFFQAEDGIRDLIVTGVQTCALPIFGLVASLEPGHGPDLDGGRLAEVAEDVEFVPARSALKRSEERRVRKECRFRWAP